MIQYKTTKRLFRSTYQYKIVLVCAGAGFFRSGDMDATLELLKKVDLSVDRYPNRNIKTQEDLDYTFKLQAYLKTLSNIEVRVESPWITVYSNSRTEIDQLINLDPLKVKYACIPSGNLDKDVIVLPKVNFDFKVTMGKTSSNHAAFVQWAENNAKLRLTNSCKRDLIKDRSWGGTYFYVTGDNNLLMAKMHLGGSINKIERIVKA